MVSLSSHERSTRIANFKHRISALRATTRAYDGIADGKSVGTLDTASSLASSRASVASSRVDSSSASAAGSVERSADDDSVVESVERRDEESDDGMLWSGLRRDASNNKANNNSRNSKAISNVNKSSSETIVSINVNKSRSNNNPYNVHPDPFEESSIDSSFIGTVVSSVGPHDVDGNTVASSNTVASEEGSVSVDGMLFDSLMGVTRTNDAAVGDGGKQSDDSVDGMLFDSLVRRVGRKSSGIEKGDNSKSSNNKKGKVESNKGGSVSSDDSDSFEYSVKSERDDSAVVEDADGSVGSLGKEKKGRSVGCTVASKVVDEKAGNPFEDDSVESSSVSKTVAGKADNPFEESSVESSSVDSSSVAEKACNLNSKSVNRKAANAFEDSSVESSLVPSKSVDETAANPIFKSVNRKAANPYEDSSVESSSAASKSVDEKAANLFEDSSVDSSSVASKSVDEKAANPFEESSVESSSASKSTVEKAANPFEESSVESSSVASSHPNKTFLSHDSKEFDADDESPKSKAVSFRSASSMDCQVYDADESFSKKNQQHQRASNTLVNVSFNQVSPVKIPIDKMDSLDSQNDSSSSSMDSSTAFDKSLERKLSSNSRVVTQVATLATKWTDSSSVDNSSSGTESSYTVIEAVSSTANRSSFEELPTREFTANRLPKEDVTTASHNALDADQSDSCSVDSSSVISPKSFKKPPPIQSKTNKATTTTEAVTKMVTPSPKKKWQMGIDSFDSGSMASTLDSRGFKLAKNTTNNPFADILAMRAKERKENNWIAEQMIKRDSFNISQMDFESSSQEDNVSEVSPDANQGKFVIENTDKVKTNPFESSGEVDNVSIGNDSDASSEDSNSSDSVSLQGTIFTDVRKALSNIQSMSYDTNEEESDDELDAEIHDDKEAIANEIDNAVPLQESAENVVLSKPDSNVSQSEAFKGDDKDDEDESVDLAAPPKHISAESCAVSSLKTTEFKGAQMPGFDVNESFDNADDVASIPRCPTSFEKIENELQVPKKARKEKKSRKTKNGKVKIKDNVGKAKESHYEEKVRDKALQDSSPSAETVAEDSSSINRVIKLSPPKKPVVIRDGSISTKDSIVGKTIHVTNAELVAERIYLESLRAQVHAELKVHVADEEIRLALEGRLNAIKDFYKRRNTVSQLKSAQDSDLKDGATFASNPKFAAYQARPKILLDGSVCQKSPQSALTDVSSLSCPKACSSPAGQGTAAAHPPIADQIKLPPPTQEEPSNSPSPHGTTMNSSTQNNQKLAYKKAQPNIQNALKAANLSMNRSGLSNGKEIDEESEQEDDDFMNRLSTRVTIPTNIYSHESSSWDDEEAMPPKSRPFKSDADAAIPAVIDAWNFYRQLNDLMSDNRVYDYEFQAIQKDPLYPYLNSLTGIADSGDDGTSAADKKVKQLMREEFNDKSPHRICHILAKEAKEIQPELIEVCEDIARKLNMHTMAVGPVKTASAALIKSEKKYGGNPLLVTDFCRVSLFVPDIATLLALIEIVLSKYAYIVKRIKLSSLKHDYNSIVGGYRDCKINVDIDGHICEIQVHLERLWNIKEESGYTHYRICFDNNVNDSAFDISRTLIGLDREFLSDLIKVGETAVKDLPVSDLEYDCEKEIRDYCALANLYVFYGLPVRAEYTLRQIVKLRTENVLFGPGHAETVMHLKLLKKSLKMQHKYKSAMSVTKRITRAVKIVNEEEDIVGLCAGDQCGAVDHICDTILDPSKKERIEEKERAQRIEDSRALWLGTRKSFFKQ
ncbi:hypothetical protein ACHAWO_002059 [Cyclotella atomus]|uniref:Uncharacterized protein n=1 Tax=Cyclotella atomus TaxID=382360 RepID=A0ABD3QBG9_9STRA